MKQRWKAHSKDNDILRKRSKIEGKMCLLTLDIKALRPYVKRKYSNSK